MTGKEDYEKFDKLVKKESERPTGDLFCPECGSSRLYYFLGFKAGQVYVCKKCGYHGPFVLEDGEMADKIKEEWSK